MFTNKSVFRYSVKRRLSTITSYPNNESAWVYCGIKKRVCRQGMEGEGSKTARKLEVLLSDICRYVCVGGDRMGVKGSNKVSGIFFL